VGHNVPVPIDASAFLADLDHLAYPDRIRALADHARAATPDLDDLLDQLMDGGFGHRQAGLFMAIAAGHGATIEAAAHSEDRWLRMQAIRPWIAGSAAAAEVSAMIADAPSAVRTCIYSALRAARRPDLAAAIIDLVRERYGDREAATVLMACPSEAVARLLPSLGHAVPNWATLASRHPRIVIAEAERCLAGLTGPARERWWTQFGIGVWTAAEMAPAAVLDLVERYAAETSLPHGLYRYGPLVRLDATRVLRLMTTPARAAWLVSLKIPRPILRSLSAVATDELVLLAQRLRARPAALAALLNAMAPSRREELFDAAFAGIDTTRSVIADVMLNELPHARRAREARRILTLPEVRDDERKVLH
jgi:hypothetical protein